MSRPPHGGRGLKSAGMRNISLTSLASPSSRRAWIEMLKLAALKKVDMVALLTEGVD